MRKVILKKLCPLSRKAVMQAGEEFDEEKAETGKELP